MIHTINFKAQFADLVRTGAKTQTIRQPRERPIRVGDTLRLYTGQRTKNCELLREVVCTRAEKIIISGVSEVVVGGDAFGITPNWAPQCQSDQWQEAARKMEAFARADGFANAEAFFAFFFEHYFPNGGAPQEMDMDFILIGWEAK